MCRNRCCHMTGTKNSKDQAEPYRMFDGLDGDDGVDEDGVMTLEVHRSVVGVVCVMMVDCTSRTGFTTHPLEEYRHICVLLMTPTNSRPCCTLQSRCLSAGGSLVLFFSHMLALTVIVAHGMPVLTAWPLSLAFSINATTYRNAKTSATATTISALRQPSRCARGSGKADADLCTVMSRILSLWCSCVPSCPWFVDWFDVAGHPGWPTADTNDILFCFARPR